MKTTLWCATGNPGKLREFQEAAGSAFDLQPFGPLDCPETGSTFEANAVQKGRCYSRSLGDPEALLFADDSGLEVDALDGGPGVHSARFAGPGADEAANNALLLEKLAGVPAVERTARYICVIALLRGERLLGTFRGEAEGLIVDEANGSGGFGYDPYFHFPELGATFAQTPAEVKWLHSHRGKAFRAMLGAILNDPPRSL